MKVAGCPRSGFPDLRHLKLFDSPSWDERHHHRALALEQTVNGGDKAMSNDTPIACPKCNHEVLIARAKLNKVSDFGGTVCDRCGYVITEEDIVAEGKKALERKINRLDR